MKTAILLTAKEIATKHEIRVQWVYERFKKEDYAEYIHTENSPTKIDEQGYALLLEEICILKSKQQKSKEDELESNNSEDSEFYKEIITDLKSDKLILLDRISHLENQISDLTALLNKSADLLSQEQMISMKSLTNTELALIEKQKLMEERKNEYVYQNRPFYKKFFGIK